MRYRGRAMGGGLANVVESLVRAVRRDAAGTPGQEPTPAPREAPAPEEPRRPRRAKRDAWKDPVPVMEDRDGHLHLLI
jgi:hypothetical protein